MSPFCSLGCRVGTPLQPWDLWGRSPLCPSLKLEASWQRRGGRPCPALEGASEILIPFLPPFRGFQGGLGKCVTLFPLGGGGVGSVCLSVCAFFLIYVSFPPILSAGDGDISPSHFGNLAGHPFLTQSEVLRRIPHFCTKLVLLPLQFWGICRALSAPHICRIFPHIFGGGAMGIFFSPFSFRGLSLPAWVTWVGFHAPAQAWRGNPSCRSWLAAMWPPWGTWRDASPDPAAS